MGDQEDNGKLLRFTGRSDHALDPKGRLNIPSRFRRVLVETYSEDLVVTNWRRSLKAYPLPVWSDIEEKLMREGRNQPGFADFFRYVISGISECVLDKQGRILLPPPLRSEFNLVKDVVLVGMLDHFEIWDQATWEAETRRARENFSSYESGLTAMGLL